METERKPLNILLVEDDDMVNRTTRDMIERSGYSVITADSPEEALEICNAGQVINLVITDVMMPDINGLQLREKILSIRPEIKILFTSGHPEDVLYQNFGLKVDAPFIQKPYSLMGLAQKIKDIMES